MERLHLVRTPLEVAKSVGHQLLGGGWAELAEVAKPTPVQPPALTLVPACEQPRLFAVPDIGPNVILGEE